MLFGWVGGKSCHDCAERSKDPLSSVNGSTLLFTNRPCLRPTTGMLAPKWAASSRRRSWEAAAWEAGTGAPLTTCHLSQSRISVNFNNQAPL
eukprot:scaffold51127_cov21-Tisochrysis_lutea.AAC.1